GNIRLSQWGTDVQGCPEPSIVHHMKSHRVECVLIGSWAMYAHGCSVATQNVEFCYSRSPKNIIATAGAFASLHSRLRGAPAGLPFHWDVPTILRGVNFALTTDLGDVDLVSEVPGLGKYERVLAQSQERTFFGLTIRVLSLDGLIVTNQAVGR